MTSFKKETGTFNAELWTYNCCKNNFKTQFDFSLTKDKNLDEENTGESYGLREQSEAFNDKPAGKVLPSGKVIDLASFLDMPGTGG